MRVTLTLFLSLSVFGGTILVAPRSEAQTRKIAQADRGRVAAVGIFSFSKRVKLVRLSHLKKVHPRKGILFRTSYRLKIGRRQLRLPRLVGLYASGLALQAGAKERFYGNEALVDRYKQHSSLPAGTRERMQRGEVYASWH